MATLLIGHLPKKLTGRAWWTPWAITCRIVWKYFERYARSLQTIYKSSLMSRSRHWSHTLLRGTNAQIFTTDAMVEQTWFWLRYIFPIPGFIFIPIYWRRATNDMTYCWEKMGSWSITESIFIIMSTIMSRSNVRTIYIMFFIPGNVWKLHLSCNWATLQYSKFIL